MLKLDQQDAELLAAIKLGRPWKDVDNRLIRLRRAGLVENKGERGKPKWTLTSLGRATFTKPQRKTSRRNQRV